MSATAPKAPNKFLENCFALWRDIVDTGFVHIVLTAPAALALFVTAMLVFGR